MSGEQGLTHGLDPEMIERLASVRAALEDGAPLARGGVVPGGSEAVKVEAGEYVARADEQLDDDEAADLLAADAVETNPDDVGVLAEGIYAGEPDEGPGAKYDTSPVGTPGGRQNWVDKAGGLPPFIRAVAHALIRAGRPKSTAIAIAVGQIKRWARGGGNVSAKTRAKAVKTVAQWEKMKASSRVKSDPAVPAGTPTTEEAAVSGSSTKDVAGAAADTGIEYKEAKVSIVDVVDEQKGIVAAIVSVTGILDRVGDIIMPGAYAKSLAQRTPKGVWSHSWEQPVSKTLEVRELMPGDPMLAGLTLRDGSPWPAEAGALWVKTQFNLDGDRGRQAFADVKFFDTDQEWSIGYNVGKGKAEMKSGIRHINELDLYEYSPVLFGAMPSAMTLTVKSAQAGFKALMATIDADELARAAAVRDGVETKSDGPDKAQRGKDGEPTDAGKPHKFAPKPDGKCKVCGLAIAGHMKAQKESATGDEKAAAVDALMALDDAPAEETKAADAPAKDPAPAASAWAPCGECGSRDADEYADGSPARCSSCGNAMKAAAAGSDAVKTLTAVVGLLTAGGMTTEQVKDALDAAGVDLDEATPGETGDGTDATASEVEQVPATPAEVDPAAPAPVPAEEKKALLTEADLARAARLRVVALDG